MPADLAPRVAVILPIHDAADTLIECLDSIRRQTLAAFEVVAVDDGSTDGSAARFREFAGADPRFRLLAPGRVGLVAALNLAIESARAPLLARMDADDLMHPRRLELQADFLDLSPDMALVASRVELFPEERVQSGYREYVRWQNGCVTPADIAANLYVESPLAHPSVMLRRSVLQGLGGYQDGPFPEDYQLWLRLHHAGHRMAKLPHVLLRWREGADRTSRVDPRYSREAFDRLRAEYLPRDPRLRQTRELVIWGAGRSTRQRVRLVMSRGVRPSAWIDIDPRKIGQRIWGLPVHPPEWLDRKPRPFVLAYVNNHGARELISGRLRAWGYRLGEDYLHVG